ncbi:hypothetical protein QYF61_020746 [Mycteria americana]|uniref:RING-type domain-containing protein n=1 Tax=Mycteria americana TaxID=33587 RepID=A0AAN7RM42_MYCAM|nr:hypothetical protein QYF61_020746 [Mycteria americana]
MASPKGLVGTRPEKRAFGADPPLAPRRGSLPWGRTKRPRHRPEQAVQASPEQNSTCIICLDLVEDKKSYRTMVCPACQHAWFHRKCIQKQAVHAGVCFRCLHCQNKDQFVMEMLTMGIRVSKRLVFLLPTHKTSGTSAVPGQGLPWQAWPSCCPLTLVLCFTEELEAGQPSWESNQAFGLVYQRHILCNARKCLCPRGREQAEEEGSWQLLLCSSCAAEGIHRRCSYLRNSATTWECDCCAGLATASSNNELELASPSTASQVALGLFQGFPAPARSGCSSHPGPDRIRHRSRLQRRAQKPYSRPGKHCGTSHVPAPSAEPSSSSTAWQMTLELFRGILELKRSSSSSTRQVASGLSPGALALESSSSSSTRQVASGLSPGALALESSSRSSHIGPIRIRHCLRLQRRAQKPYSRPGRRC